MSIRSKVFFGIAFALCLLMPSTQSLWIDEAQTWVFSSIPTFGALFSDLATTYKSEGLMPLGMLLPWLSIRVLGASEWQLRAMNILWAAATVGAFFVLGRRWRMPWAPLFMAAQPFLWYYANEARPYALQIAAASWLLVGLVTCVEDRRLGKASLLILLISSAILIATVLFGILTVGPVCLLIAWLAWRERWPLCGGWKIAVALALVWNALFGIYYLRAVMHGATGAKLWEVGMQNVAFGFYELLGMSGLGPSRYEIRELARTEGIGGALHTFSLLSVLSLVALAISYVMAATSLFGRGKKNRERRTLGIIGGCAVASIGTLVVLAFVVHFPFWGRHMAPAFPFLCGLLILALRGLRARSRPLAAVVVPVLFVLFAMSSWALRSWPRHGKDDYRAAAEIARRAVKEGRVVWWCADLDTAHYYGLSMSAPPDLPGPLVFVNGSSAETLAAKPPPDFIVISKPDIFDTDGAVTEYAKQSGYYPSQRMNAFVVYARPLVSRND